MRRQIPFRLDEETLQTVDERRGDVSRQRWLERAVEQALGGPETSGAGDAPSPAPARRSSPPTGETPLPKIAPRKR